MLWEEQRGKILEKISEISDENASIREELNNLLNINPDELTTLAEAQQNLKNANTRLEEVRKTNRELLDAVSKSGNVNNQNGKEDDKISFDKILEKEGF